MSWDAVTCTWLSIPKWLHYLLGKGKYDVRIWAAWSYLALAQRDCMVDTVSSSRIKYSIFVSLPVLSTNLPFSDLCQQNYWHKSKKHCVGLSGLRRGWGYGGSFLCQPCPLPGLNLHILCRSFPLLLTFLPVSVPSWSTLHCTFQEVSFRHFSKELHSYWIYVP